MWHNGIATEYYFIIFYTISILQSLMKLKKSNRHFEPKYLILVLGFV